VVHGYRIKPSQWQAAALVALLAALLLVLPHQARAQGLFDFIFGGSQRPTPPANVNSYAPPSPGIDRVVPAPLGSESVRQDGGNIGRTLAFCVRLCDGQHFPMEHVTNATSVETCRAMCPASKTKVFFGGEIGGSVARDGQRYADADNAYLYRKQLVANCTCNGKDAFGLAHFDMTQDTTLRPGDIVATKKGFVAYTDSRGQGGTFTPVSTADVEAQLVPGANRVRMTRRAEPPAAAVAEDEPGTIVPAQSVTPAQGLRPTSPSAQSFR